MYTYLVSVCSVNAHIDLAQANSDNDPGFASRARSASDCNANMAAGSGGKSSGGGSTGFRGKSCAFSQLSSNKK